MSDPQAATWANEAARKKDLRRQKRARIKDAIRMFCRSVFWKVLHACRLGWPYQRLQCRLGIYKQYQRGICGYCGKPHVKPRKRESWEVMNA